MEELSKKGISWGNPSVERKVAVRILMLIEEGMNSDEAIDYYISRFRLTPPRSSLITSIVYLTLHHLKFVDGIIDNLLHSGKSLPRTARWILRIGAVQHLVMEKIPPYAIVNESVNLAKEEKLGKLIGVINAVLRKITTMEKLKSVPSIEELYPEWIIEEARLIFKSEYKKFLYSMLHRPPITIRPNLLVTDREKLFTKISQKLKCTKTLYSPIGIKVEGSKQEIQRVLGSEEYFVQDEGSQLVVFLLNLKKGQKILDTCAAPGGKGTLVQGILKNSAIVDMVDISKKRIGALKKVVKTHRVKVRKIIAGDITKNIPDIKKNEYDIVMVDAPCTDLGVIRRHPEIKWRRTKNDAEKMSSLQQKIINKGIDYLKTGGHLLYTVCTFTEEETYKVVENVLQKKQVKLVSLSQIPHIPSAMIFNDTFLLTRTDLFGTDTFFACIFKKL